MDVNPFAAPLVHGFDYFSNKYKQMSNQAIIEKFYTAFAAGQIEDMLECYHPEIKFEDPAFGAIEGDRAKGMWSMLLERSKGDIDISFRDVESLGDKGSAKWKAVYQYGPKKRNVVNEIEANFVFKDGKIIEHKDDFDLWKWSKQALGVPGLLLGWSGFMRNKIQKTTNGLLDKYMSQ